MDFNKKLKIHEFVGEKKSLPQFTPQLRGLNMFVGHNTYTNNESRYHYGEVVPIVTNHTINNEIIIEDTNGTYAEYCKEMLVNRLAKLLLEHGYIEFQSIEDHISNSRMIEAKVKIFKNG